MRIIFAANWKKGNFADMALDALRRMGCEILFLTPVDCPHPEALKVAPDIDIAAFIAAEPKSYDLFIFADCSERVPFVPRNVAAVSIPTAFWALDNHLNLRWHKEYCALFDYAFFTQYDRMKKAADIYGYPHLHWLPYCGDDKFHADRGVERDIDVGMVAAVTPARRRFFDALEAKGVRVTLNDRYLVLDEVGEFYSRCKIVLNVSARYDLNMRAFEAAIAGALVIGQRELDSSFRRIFTPGKDCDVHWFDDAADVIKKYLADDALRAALAKAGQKKVLEGHTYRHRFAAMFDICKQGTTPRRAALPGTWKGHIKMALTLGHNQFRLYREAWRELAAAFLKNPPGAAIYILRFACHHLLDKLEKRRMVRSKAPA